MLSALYDSEQIPVFFAERYEIVSVPYLTLFTLLVLYLLAALKL